MAPGDESSTLEILPAAGLRAARPRAPRFPPLYQLIRKACAPLLRSRFGLEISGLEGVPAEGPFILAANHHNYLDGVVLGVAVPRPISFLVMPRVFRASPLHPALPSAHRLHPVNLERPTRGHEAHPPRARRGRRGRDFPEGPLQSRGTARPRPAGSGHDGLARRRARGARGDQRHLRGARRAAVSTFRGAVPSPFASGPRSTSTSRAGAPATPSATRSPAASWGTSRRCCMPAVPPTRGAEKPALRDRRGR
jgi:hypothetical protein